MTDAANKIPPGLALSREELWAVMRLLKAPWVPGIEPLDVEHPLAPEQAQAVEEGARALMARGFLTVAAPATPNQPTEAELPAPVIALVGVCATSPYDLFLSLRRPQPPQAAHLHQQGALGVIHTMPQPDIHLFEPLAGRAGVMAAAEELLGLEAQKPAPLADGVIAAPKLRQVHQSAGAPPATIIQMLREGGLASPLAEAVTAALTTARATGIVTVLRPSAGPTGGATLGVIVAPEVCFTLTPDAEAARYTVKPSSAEAIRAWISAQLPA